MPTGIKIIRRHHLKQLHNVLNTYQIYLLHTIEYTFMGFRILFKNTELSFQLKIRILNLLALI